MSRKLIGRGTALLAVSVVSVGVAFAAGHAEETLTGQGLHRSGETFVTHGEDLVKKAAVEAEGRLKEYKRADAREKNAARDAVSRKAMAAELTKRRAAMKKEMDQTLPQLRSQIQALQQEQNMLRQQGTGGRYGGRFASMAHNQQVNALSAQISMVQSQTNQINAEYNELGAEINQLDPKAAPGATKGQFNTPSAAATSSGPSAEDRRQAYVDALTSLRNEVDETTKAYATLAEDPKVAAAIAELNKQSPKIKHALGPSKHFLDTVKALEEAEAKVTSDTIIDEPKPSATSTAAKRKSKSVKRTK